MSYQGFVAKHLLKKFKIIKDKSEVYRRHKVLHKQYKSDPSLAMIIDSSEVIGTNFNDPFRTSVLVNKEMKVPFKIGVHKAVGGDHDFPNPGDLLCASLAACLDCTIRMISNRIGIELTQTKITASANVDVRGTLGIDKSVPIGFQSMHVDIVLVAGNIDEKILRILMSVAKRSCIIYQTIKQGIPITFNVNFETTSTKITS